MAAKKKVSKKKTVKKKTAVKIEKDFGDKLMAFLKLKVKISKANKVVNELKSQASEMEKELIPVFEDTKTLRADVKIGSVTLNEDYVYNAKDWGKVWKYIFKKKDSGLVQKRLSQALLKEYYEDGIKIEGIERMKKKSLGIGFKRSG